MKKMDLLMKASTLSGFMYIQTSGPSSSEDDEEEEESQLKPKYQVSRNICEVSGNVNVSLEEKFKSYIIVKIKYLAKRKK